MTDTPLLPTDPDVRVRVEVQYLAAHSQPGRHAFSYVITIENHSDQTWQLLTRHWKIVDAGGRETTVDGEGVVGQQPHLAPGAVYVYDSFVTVQDTPGVMGGHYGLRDAWGAAGKAIIPPFVLDVPGARVLN